MAGSGVAHLRNSCLLRVEDLVVDYSTAHGRLSAVARVSFDIAEGETLGLVGESGCGKSTTGRALMQLPRPSGGRIWFEGADLTQLDGRTLRPTRARMQMIFQDPNASLNPLRRVNNIVLEGLRFSRGRGKRDRVRADAVLRAVGLDPDVVGSRRPHEFSGGQCQRICIARALVLEPRLLICDEPVSALDVSVQAQILNLLEDMKLRYGLTMLFISHDMAVVRNISDRIMVMYLGKVCEVASTEVLFERPAHPYTAALLASIPRPHPPAEEDEPMLSGEPPSPVDPPSGCRFRTRCPKAQPRCASEEPEMQPVGSGHFAACHYPNVV